MNLINAKVRKALEEFWTDSFTVYQKQKVTDPVTHITDFEEVQILTDIPCHLSIQSGPPAQGDPVASVSQSVQLFLSPDITIPPGCKIVVTRQNAVPREMVFTSSGIPGFFHNHQTINLVLFERYA